MAINPMLCKMGHSVKQVFEMMRKQPFLVQNKFDGERILVRARARCLLQHWQSVEPAGRCQLVMGAGRAQAGVHPGPCVGVCGPRGTARSTCACAHALTRTHAALHMTACAQCARPQLHRYSEPDPSGQGQSKSVFNYTTRA